MSWVPHGSSNSGFIQTSHHGQSQTVPAVAAQRGRLWCMWTDLDGNVWYAVTEAEGAFSPRVAFPERGLPVMANLNGHLHAVIVLQSGDMAHYLFDDEEELAWACLGPLGSSGAAVTHSSPCLVAFHNKLFLAFLKGTVLYYAVWTNSTAHPPSASDPTGAWSEPVRVTETSQAFDGIPALFVINGVLHLLCGAASAEHEILCYSFNYTNSTWLQTSDVSEGRAARGVSATSYGDNAYLGFIAPSPDNQTSQAVSIASFTKSQWQPHESIDNQTASDPPQIAILNGRIHCIFNDTTPSKNLRWYSRPILAYSLSSWMSTLPASVLVSRLTIPGTHDSCARSNIPFVRTQYLSITQQLALGIRFLDLRLRKRGDGQLFCYHGGVPLGMPRRLSFASVMDEVWAFLRGPDGTLPATETVLVSINNDDNSASQRANPEIFYRAVEDAIAATPPYPDGTHRWFTEPVTPRLGEARGRAVLFRRYQGDPAVEPTARQGLDLSAWVDDSPEFTIVTPTGVRVHLQDKWKFAERIALKDLVAAKSGFVKRLMACAAGEGILEDSDTVYRDEDWYINFCSAVGDPVERGEIAEAKWIAVGAHSNWVGKWVNGMNWLTRAFLREQLVDEGAGGGGGDEWRKCRLGIVNLDYPELPEDNDLVACLIETNFSM
ncbi:phosphatidylinositol-specific phospholipase [Podospora appendiculata]|uniref:Phosphatidylinositol-specific phospholipase n=1 Tax=Podospora appendiculata TaxID=314037 RepID=A0AAE1CBI8_9PEZI|nr:phosphatidylinositol-specific phospholipase [Podospora appendiculata]